MREQLAITRAGVVSSLGIGFENFRHGLQGPFRFSRRSELLNPNLQEGVPVADVSGFDPTAALGEKGLRNFDRLTKLLLVAAREAIGNRAFPSDRIGVCTATNYGSLESIAELHRVALLEDPRYVNPARFPNTVVNSSSGYVSIREELRGPNVTIVDGHAGGVDAFTQAAMHFELGRADAFLVGGAEALCDSLFLGMKTCGVLASADAKFEPGTPSCQGTRLGEGACYLLVERRRAGGTALAHILATASAFDPPRNDKSVVHVSEVALKHALESALDSACVRPSEVDAVMIGATGIECFDIPELRATHAVFGKHTAVFAPKRATGETFGASAALATSALLAAFEGASLEAIRVGEPGRNANPIRTAVVVAASYYGNVSASVVRKA